MVIPILTISSLKQGNPSLQGISKRKYVRPSSVSICAGAT